MAEWSGRSTRPSGCVIAIPASWVQAGSGGSVTVCTVGALSGHSANCAASGSRACRVRGYEGATHRSRTLPQWSPGRSLRPAAGRITLDGMADTREDEITDEMRALCEQHGLGPDDLFKLPSYLELAKELGIELKDLLDAENSTVVTVVNHTQHALIYLDEMRTAPPDWNGADGDGPGKHGPGALKILPPNRIEPGETATFMSAETDRSLGTGDEGWVRYAIGTKEHADVLIHWNNPTAGANKGDSQLAFPQGKNRPDGTVIDFDTTVAYADSGSTMVPYEFVVLEEGFGGGGDGVVDKNSCVITVMNETTQS